MNPVIDLLTAHLRDLRAQIGTLNTRADSIEAQIVKLATNRPPEPAMPIKRDRADGWSPEEDAVIRENYPEFGAPRCAELLPCRSAMAIRVRASRVLKVKRLGGVGVRGPRIWCDQCQRRVTGLEADACQSEFCKASEAA